MNLFQKQQTTTSGYITIPDAIADDGTTVVVHRSSMWRGMIIAFVAGMMLVAGGAVWMQDESSSYTTTAEGLVIATEADPMLAAGGAVWMQDESSYTTTAEGLVVATEATPDYFRLCGGVHNAHNCCSTDFGTHTGAGPPPRFECPHSKPLCEDYIYGNRYGHCVRNGCAYIGEDVYDPTRFHNVPATCCYRQAAVLQDGKYICPCPKQYPFRNPGYQINCGVAYVACATCKNCLNPKDNQCLDY